VALVVKLNAGGQVYAGHSFFTPDQKSSRRLSRSKSSNRSEEAEE
jgi:hypothetical protein